ncbi:nuclease s1 [Niveomyces insectorum RCEF 264]|uniref:Nuclease s1 n=1 Tax=Niveomyces insectorum RCEF 264 TaxID=1081102 RepID=A0A167UL55_9HYPO|nr:nuclease s1 [Niveomyces insectorum RCEF 264]
MKLSTTLAAGAVVLPSVAAWGGFGHITIAYVASSFVHDRTAATFQGLLRNQSAHYLAGVATWADSIRYTKWGHFTGPFHFIDAKDDPPARCDVVLARDCKAAGCVVSALGNYTDRLLDHTLSAAERAQAAKFVVHFVGDMHQPLHAEDVQRGGNGIAVQFDGRGVNLHHVWDTSIPEKYVGGVHGPPYAAARQWADALVASIRDGKFRAESRHWLADTDLADVNGTALRWAQQSNAYVCTHVLPQGPAAIAGQELGSGYYEAAVPVVEVQIARAGYRLAAWLDLIADKLTTKEEVMGEL